MTDTEYQERKLELLERQAVALEAIVAILPELIEATRSKGYSGRSNSTGKDYGIYMRMPKLDDFSAGDSFSVIASSFTHNADKGRVYFYAPFADINDSTRYAYLTSAKDDSKHIKELFGGREITSAGELLPRRLKMVVGVDKEDKTKRYAFVAAIKQVEGDIDSLTFVDAMNDQV